MELIRQTKVNSLGNSAFLDSREKVYIVINKKCEEYNQKFVAKRVYRDMVLCSWLGGNVKESWILIDDTNMEIFN